MGLTISYKYICYTLNTNTNIVKREMRKKIMIYWFFISYNNINIYEHMCDTHIFNQRAQINFTIGYIYFLGPYR